MGIVLAHHLEGVDTVWILEKILVNYRLVDNRIGEGKGYLYGEFYTISWEGESSEDGIFGGGVEDFWATSLDIGRLSTATNSEAHDNTPTHPHPLGDGGVAFALVDFAFEF